MAPTTEGTSHGAPPMVQTLRLSNMPTTRLSNKRAVLEVLKAIDAERFSMHEKDFELPRSLPEASEELQYVDKERGIVSISRPKHLRTQCFVGFVDPAKAKAFADAFRDQKLIMGNKVVEIEPAKHEAYWFIEQQNEKSARNLRKRMQVEKDPQLRTEAKQKRRLRRLRCRLRKKGLQDAEVVRIVADINKKAADKPKTLPAPKDPVPGPAVSRSDVPIGGDKKIKTVDVGNNPPNKVLLAQGLPKDLTEETLVQHFAHDKLLQVRMVGVRQLAFLEYEDVGSATEVLDRLGRSYIINGLRSIIGYAKK